MTAVTDDRPLLDYTAPIRNGHDAASDEPEWYKRRQTRLAELRVIAEAEQVKWRDAGLQIRATADQAAESMLLDGAVRECRWCGSCGRDLAAGEPVWRLRGRRRWLQPICADCRWCYAPWSGPCGYCGRTVHELRYRAMRFCSTACSDRYTADFRRERRAAARAGRRCEQCAELLDAGRVDARYCSSACRQKAYRQRKADISNLGAKDGYVDQRAVS